MSGDSVRVASPLFPVEGQGSIPMSPLQFEIEIIDQKKAMLLNKMWHSRMPRADFYNICRPCFGAVYKNIYYASAIWTDPITRAFNGKNYLELRRMAISEDSPKNTASRIICIMAKEIKNQFPKIWKLISYQDTEVHSGTIYKASNWVSTNISSKSNWLVGRKDGIHRNNYQASGPKIRWEKQIRPEPETIIKPPKKPPQKGLFF